MSWLANIFATQGSRRYYFDGQVIRDSVTKNQVRTPYEPKPRLVAVNAAPTREEFDAWSDEPVTQFVMRALEHNAHEYRDMWMRESWEGGVADQRRLDGLRERTDALLGFTGDYEAFCETLNLAPEEEEDQRDAG